MQDSYYMGIKVGPTNKLIIGQLSHLVYSTQLK